MGSERRRFLSRGGALLAGAATLGACARRESDDATAPRTWRMVTSWPPGFAGLGAAASRLAAAVTQASAGRLAVRVYGGGELVAPFEVFAAVGDGRAEIGHSASHYWATKLPAAPFFCAVPFGLNAQEMNAWLLHGGGLPLWRELYAPHNLIPFPAGNTGAQLAGWFNREITSLADFAGLRIRIPGLGAEVVARLGATAVNVPGTEIFAALKSGALDGAEWMGPHNDLEFGLFRVARYAYYPGWQEPGATLECVVNKRAYEALPEDLRAIVERCCLAANDELLAEYTVANARALAVLTGEHQVRFRRLPDPLLAALKRASTQALDALAERDAFARRVYDAWRGFRDQVRAWHAQSEIAYYQARS
jgi:TRAP-type mannitol/chloroaromatic compound transport system substrate-binding protein